MMSYYINVNLTYKSHGVAGQTCLEQELVCLLFFVFCQKQTDFHYNKTKLLVLIIVKS